MPAEPAKHVRQKLRFAATQRGSLGRAIGLCLLATLVSMETVHADETRTATVGMSDRIEQLVLPGSELEVKPRDDDRIPIVIRITGSFPHGTEHRYDIVYYGLEPGKFDLTDYLKRKDGSSTEGLPEVVVEIKPVLAPGQIRPNRLQSKSAPFLGGYRILLLVAAIVWVVGLIALLFVGRGNKPAADDADQPPLTLADRLRPSIEDAIAGKLTQSQQAELERLLLAFWRKRLNLEEMKAAEAIGVLRDHEEAGGLLRQLELWLHRPDHDDSVNVADLLKPYQDIPADALPA
ncbi:MAG: hypothetical protein HOL01_18885 [Planctomycetaceae bacterium]|jgi:hypothetical protein|nr:hypothetical protein [Planctomycetaceae bacterium]MBT6483847.1 hypothetical protein [Planctomycetaceae bacterium]MBT6496605.1 hypothetical protein [Planctomycetaceae bacterium]